MSAPTDKQNISSLPSPAGQIAGKVAPSITEKAFFQCLQPFVVASSSLAQQPDVNQLQNVIAEKIKLGHLTENLAPVLAVTRRFERRIKDIASSEDRSRHTLVKDTEFSEWNALVEQAKPSKV